jgi:hypothetical protein
MLRESSFALARFLDDGAITIDYRIVERQHVRVR